jgi:AP-3 complex subunit delta-1
MGLQLDSWIVAPLPKPKTTPTNGKYGDETTRSRKGKGRSKDTGDGKNGATKAKGEKRRKKVMESAFEEYVVEETPEEIVAREQARAERLERMRDDPYYIKDDGRSSKRPDDIDSIPVIRLDDEINMPTPSRKTPSQLSIPLSSPRRSSSPISFVVDKGGEMPEGATTPPLVAPAPRRPISQETSLLSAASSSVKAPPISAFEPYEVESDRVPTPNPVKVVSKKKKKTTGKSKGSLRTEI